MHVLGGPQQRLNASTCMLQAVQLRPAAAACAAAAQPACRHEQLQSKATACDGANTPPTCTDSATAATAWCAAAAWGDTSGWLLASVSSGGSREARWPWMAAPARGNSLVVQ